MQENQDVLNNMQSVMADLSVFENKTDEEKKETIRLFLKNIKFFKDLIIQQSKEKDDDIIKHKRFIKYLDYIPQNSKIKELLNKENELIYYLKEEVFFLYSSSLTLGHLENIILSSEKVKKLEDEINVIIDLLEKEGITELEEYKL